ncbi:MAG TPA: permease-like cell division protein FtsX, partial [Chitinophagales bacterium]|nr:permease-like cell division protein FtsX [Chitinophagales bacterium]
MQEQVGKAPRKRSKPSYIYSIISITLVLFMLGILGHVLLFSQKLSEYFRESIEISIILKDGLSEADIFQFQKKLEKKPYIKSTKYISKEDAAKILAEDFGEDLSILGYNPLYASINFHLRSEYANSDSLAAIEAELKELPQVSEIYYFKAIVDLINQNIRKVTLILAGISAMLILIAITLIDNTIRLAMYSNRFLIKSMQLVGATRWFIIKPFMGRSLLNGFISGVLAVTMLIGLLYYAQLQLPTLIVSSDDLFNFAVIFVSII